MIAGRWRRVVTAVARPSANGCSGCGGSGVCRSATSLTPGVTYAYISRIEAGGRRPSVKALRMLARRLGVTAEYLETGTDLAGSELRELRLVELELRLRLDGELLLDELDELLADATAAGDVKAAARARIALGLAAAGRGDHDETIVQLEEALSTEVVSPLSRTDVCVTLGQAYAARGAPRLAVGLLERALPT